MPLVRDLQHLATRHIRTVGLSVVWDGMYTSQQNSSEDMDHPCVSTGHVHGIARRRSVGYAPGCRSCG